MLEKNNKFDCIVVGSGLIGASIAWSLLGAGKKVLLLDAKKEHNDFGSSHGGSRISRIGDEHPSYPLWTEYSRRAMQELEDKEGEIIASNSCVNIVKKYSMAYEKIKNSAKNCHFECTEVSAEQLRKRGFKGIFNEYVGLYDKKAAIMNPHMLLSKLYEKIKEYRGQIYFNTKVEHWLSAGNKVRINNGQFEANNLIFATNGWTPEILQKGNAIPQIIKPLVRTFSTLRVPIFFFEWPETLKESIIRMPHDDGHGNMYAMKEITPDGKVFLKIGFHSGTATVSSPDKLNRVIAKNEIDKAAAFLEGVIGIKPVFSHASMCHYCMTKSIPKEKVPTPLIGRLPGFANIYLAAGFCGNGAKFCSQIGDILKDLVLGKEPLYNLSDFDPSSYISQKLLKLANAPTLHSRL